MPADLQKTYEAAYAKVVTQPANNVLPLLPKLQALSSSVIDTGDFLQAQNNSVSFANNNVQFATQDQVKQYNTLVADIASSAPVLGQLKTAISSVQ